MNTDGACAVSLECWRISLIAELLNDSNESPGLRHAVRRITETLKGMGIEVVDFAGRPYEPGMVPEVVEVREDQGLTEGHAVIHENYCADRGLARTGYKALTIIVKRSQARPKEHTKAVE